MLAFTLILTTLGDDGVRGSGARGPRYMHPCFEEIVPNHDAGNHLATTVGAEMNGKGMRFLLFRCPLLYDADST